MQVSVSSLLRGVDDAHTIHCETVYTLTGDGAVLIEGTAAISAAMPPLPRIGLELCLPGEFEQLTWYGRGPWENYVDRKTAAMVGQYSSSVSAQFEPCYLLPGECGGKEDVRWLALVDAGGTGLLIRGRPLLHFDALHYSMPQLTAAQHPYELTPRPEIYLHLDAYHMGVGGDTGWSLNVHPEYLLPPGKYTYAVCLRPLAAC